MAINDDNLIYCFLHLPDQAGIPFVMEYKTIGEVQIRDANLMALAAKYPAKYLR